MKVLEHTPTRLKLQRHPTLFSGFLLVTLWLLGATLLGMGVFIGQAVSVRSLSCQRVEATQVDCELIGSNGFKAPVSTTPITAVQKATVATDPLGEAPEFSVILYAQTHEFEFSNSNDRASQEAIAQQLNDFIQNPNTTSITLQEDDRGLQLWVSAGLALAGLGLIIVGIDLQATVTYTFDKYQNNLTLDRRLLLQNRTTSYPLDCLKYAYLLNDSDKASTILLTLQNHATKQIQLTNAVYTHTRVLQQELVDAVNQFINAQNQ